MRLKVDENLPDEVRDLLREAGHDATSVTDEGLRGKADTEIAAACRREHRALITLDVHFANIIAYPPGEHEGIIVLRSESQSKPAVLALCHALLKPLESGDVSRRLWIAEPGRLRVRR